MHPDLIGKPTEFLKKETQCLTKFVNTDTNLIKVSYLTCLITAKYGKHHTISETLLPAAVDMVQAVLGEKAAKEI